MKMLEVNTVSIKDLIKKKGGKWDSSKKIWMVPCKYHEELEQIARNKSNSKILKEFYNDNKF